MHEQKHDRNDKKPRHIRDHEPLTERDQIVQPAANVLSRKIVCIQPFKGGKIKNRIRDRDPQFALGLALDTIGLLLMHGAFPPWAFSPGNFPFPGIVTAIRCVLVPPGVIIADAACLKIAKSVKAHHTACQAIAVYAQCPAKTPRHTQKA